MNRARSKDGKYDYDNFELVCECGHTLGVHCAANESRLRPCFNGDTGEDCDCENFKKKRDQTK